MRVLSLFDGISCGRIALERAGIKVDNYYASEIKKQAIQVVKENYPDTIHIGDVRNVKGEELPKIDLLIVTGGDINLAFEILNKRYMTKKTTIISSECLEADLTKIDDATCGRILEMCGDEYLTCIAKDANKNHRKR